MFSEKMKTDLIEGLCSIFAENIRRIILYGSVARDAAGTESDIDIAIIVSRDMDETTRETFIQWAAEMDLRYDRVFSIIDIRDDRMKKWGDILPFYRNIQKEGVILWRAA